MMCPILKNVTRKAFLISSPGTGSNYLEGTVRDLENMYNFLTSPRGALYFDNEIVLMDNPTWDDAKEIIEDCNADYIMIYFSGHGYSDGGRRYLCFYGNDVEDVLLFNSNGSKQLIIADSCRTHLKAVSGIPPAEENWLSYTGDSWARDVFDEAIRSSPDGLIIVHGTHDGAAAYDLRSGIGGAFTFSLLTTTLTYKSKVHYAAIGIKELIPITTELLHHNGFDQNPEIFEAGNLQIPFLINADQTEVIHASTFPIH